MWIPTLKDCGNCSGKLLEFRKGKLTCLIRESQWHIHCCRCGMAGPSSLDQVQAIENWNQLVDKIKDE